MESGQELRDGWVIGFDEHGKDSSINSGFNIL